MIFSDPTNKQGLVQDVYFGINANSASYSIADVTRNINNGIDKVSSIIMKADNRWQFDDNNSPNLPIATTNLINNQQDYTFDDSFLEVLKVLVADKNGDYYEVFNIDVTDQGVSSYLENKAENKGNPIRYDIVGNSILLDPRPDYDLADGLKVYFKTKAEYFTTTDTTKSPGFASQFHKYLSLFAQYEFAYAKNLRKAEQLMRDMQIMEKDIASFYAKRGKDYQQKFIPRYRNPS